MKIPTTESLIRDARRVLEHPFWIPTLSADTFYERAHDDHDGTFEGRITVSFDKMGDAWLIVDKPGRALRFRTLGGGGNSLRVRNALMLLAEAIRLDSLERPEPDLEQPQKAQR